MRNEYIFLYLVKEDDTGPTVLGPEEDGPDCPLALADVHVDELGPLHADEVDPRLVGDGLGHQRLAAPGRAHQQHS